jgi:hypothetical protein
MNGHATCRSCGAAIVWALTASGRLMPVDANPAKGGNVRLSTDALHDHQYVATVVGPLEALIPADSQPLHVAHFVTCPDSDRWRR